MRNLSNKTKSSSQLNQSLAKNKYFSLFTQVKQHESSNRRLQLNTNKFNMRDLEWGKIAKLQDELAIQQQKRKRQRETFHKMLYKNELEKMIEEKNKNLRIATQSQRKKYSESYKTLDYANTQESRRSKTNRFVKESSDYNYDTGRNKRIRMRSQLEEDKTYHREKYRKAQTQRSEQRQKQSLEKMIKKKELERAYQQQMNSIQSRKHLERMQNRKFEELAQEVEARKEIERLQHINRIRYGYSQNPQTYETIRQIYNKKEEVRQAFLKKLQTEKNHEQQTIYRKRSQQVKQTSNFNKNYFLERQLRKKQQTQREAQQQNTKLFNIQIELMQQAETERLRKQKKQRQLQLQLELQMNEASKNRSSLDKMSENQFRINRSLNPVSIPGLYRDHKDIRKDQIIDSFLKNQNYTITPCLSEPI